MCPLCLTTVGYVVAGAASTGGLAAALAVKISRRRNARRESPANMDKRSTQHDEQHNH
jgi:hypothetical protein